MRNAETVTFGGSGLDRAEDLRRDPAVLAQLRDTARILPLWRGKPLLNAARSGLAFAKVGDLPADGLEVFLGRDDQGAIFARDVSDMVVEGADADDLGAFVDTSEQTAKSLPTGSAFVELRRCMTWINGRDAELAAMARAVLEWHRSHGFCANCGAATQPAKAGFQRNCDTCGRQHFPRTDPVVIMLITHGNDVLVGRSHGWPEGMYSLLAGFVDPGETIEAAVRREVWEEAGVRISNVGYLASQPWPFPASLMVGCHGDATSREITVDQDEIEDAIWVSREDMLEALEGRNPALSPARKGSIARFLIENWLADSLG